MSNHVRKRYETVQQNENVYTKPVRDNLKFEQSAVASENDLDDILRDVEKMETNARCKDKPKWKPSIQFTQKDEDELDQIFDAAKRRKKQIEKILATVKQSNSCDDGDDDDDNSSKSSSSSATDSSDSEVEDFLDDVESEKELEITKKAVTRLDEEMNSEMEKILEEVEQSESKAHLKKHN